MSLGAPKDVLERRLAVNRGEKLLDCVSLLGVRHGRGWSVQRISASAARAKGERLLQAVLIRLFANDELLTKDEHLLSV